uniref:NADH dehydrogenase subunit 4 n=1 Tax=Bolbosoma nipponicum TaxID=1167864 RepID=UPI002E771287|nr:NADH dehydrogenase subunit 4 [Bolbosoma nipponicum]WPN89834.1 NADH dehydrogenase subunit 4 [Bolbosoma nipponicum]
MMGGLLKNLFFGGGLIALVLWYVFILKFCVGVGFFYEGLFLYLDKLCGGLLLLGLGVWVLMSGIYVRDCGGRFGKEVLVSGVLMVLLSVVFLVDSWLGFYVVYEGSVVPLMVAVILFGGYYERLGSVLYLLVYMVLFSVPLVVVLLVCLGEGQSLVMGEWGLLWIGGVGLLLVVMGLLVKVPIYGLHSWLPKVHVEAPTWGSVVLAAVMIKMGVYGLWRLRSEGAWCVGLGEIFWLWALLGAVVCCVLCLMGTDFKLVVAYSSVVHMGGVVWLGGFGLVSGWRGLLLVMLMHGVVSGGLFIMAGSLGDLCQSRSLILLSGAIDFLSVWGMMLIVGLVLNVGFPISGNMLGELEIVFGVCGLWGLGWILVSFLMFLGCLFNLYVVMVLSSAGIDVDSGVVSGVVLASGVLFSISVVGLVGLGLLM